MKTEQEIQAKIEELEKELAEIEESYGEEIESAEDEKNVEGVEELEGDRERKTKKLEKQIEILKWVLS
ncbi:MAG: hypothetical protein QMD77_02265 [Patescibacteria group bacterium]|nr:hypothetical protein [Patescibacteria group bacterium]